MTEKLTKTEVEVSSRKKYWKDVLETVPMKLVILTFCGGAICVFPFLVLHMQLLGITIREIATIFLIIPIASLFGPLISGLIADKSGKFSVVFIFNAILGTISFNLLLLVPPVPKNTVSVTCNSDYSLTLTYENCNDCILAIGSTKEAIVLKDCRVCDDEISGLEIPCDEESATLFYCPVFNATQQIHLNVTNPSSSVTSESSCNLDIYKISEDNVTSSVHSVCDVKSTCTYRCQVEQDIEKCKEMYGLSVTFFMYTFFIFLAHFFMAAAFTMMDASILTYVKEKNVDLGKQRIMAMIGFGLAPLLAGMLVDLYTKKTGIVSYFPAFMLADVLLAIGCIIVSMVNLKAASNDSNIFKDFGKLLSKIEVDVFLLIVLVLGCNFGFIETYLFIYLKSLDAPNFLLGLTMTVGCLSSIPMLFCADWFENKIGRQNVFLLCFSAYSARMLGYSFIRDPWMCLIFEVLEAVTYQLMWVTCLKLCPLLAPKGMLATMTGLAGAFHYSFGKGFGGFFGGYIIEQVGIRITFRIFAGIALGGGVLYLIMHHTVLKKKIAIREREIKEEEEIEERKKQSGEGETLINQKKRPSRDEETGAQIRRSIIALSPSASITGIPGLHIRDEDRSEYIQNIFSDSLPHLTTIDSNGHTTNRPKSEVNEHP